MRKLRRSRVCCSTELSQDPPTEFRIFRAGENATTKGTAIFDEAAASSVLAAFEAYGNDLMIDLEHQALDASDKSREDAADARGWFKLEVRDGELWAVDVSWTPDGTQRLKDRTQRYISPAFYMDDDGRVLELINVALVAMPATFEAQALVASRRDRTREHRVAANATPSLQDVSRAVESVLIDLYKSDQDEYPWLYICDLYDTQVVYEWDGLLYRIGYSYSNGVASLTSEPEQVIRQYVGVQQAAKVRARAYQLLEKLNGPRKDQGRNRGSEERGRRRGANAA